MSDLSAGWYRGRGCSDTSNGAVRRAQSRQSRQADARQVRRIDFERAFLTPDDGIPLLLVYRDQLPLKHVADILGCSPQLALHHADTGLSKLTDVLDRLHLL